MIVGIEWSFRGYRTCHIGCLSDLACLWLSRKFNPVLTLHTVHTYCTDSQLTVLQAIGVVLPHNYIQSLPWSIATSKYLEAVMFADLVDGEIAKRACWAAHHQEILIVLPILGIMRSLVSTGMPTVFTSTCLGYHLASGLWRYHFIN